MNPGLCGQDNNLRLQRLSNYGVSRSVLQYSVGLTYRPTHKHLDDYPFERPASSAQKLLRFY